MVRVRAMAVFVIGFACYACGGGTAAPPATSSTSSAPATPAPAASSTPAASAAPAAAASTGTDFGVPECDNYLKKYVACVDKLAPTAQGAMRQALDQTRAAWKQAATTEQGKAALASTCKAASDSAAPAMKAQGCNW
jgi:hypothetical protein